MDDTHFPLIDEPTNHLDISGRKQVAAYLKKKKQGFIVVSHDRGFIDEVVDHVLAIEKVNWNFIKGISLSMKNRKLRDEFEMAQNEKLKKKSVG
ncbi:hypothetical protein LOS23_07835 [Enterococcus faecium]|nr:hypothetical protein [Enterococcus faecium]